MATKARTVNRRTATKSLRSKPTSAYKTCEVSCFDLARLLDWAESTTVRNSHGRRVSIDKIPWYAEAHSALSRELLRAIGTGWEFRDER